MNLRFKLLLILLLALLPYCLITSKVMAAEYYVSPNGSDSNPGTAANPWKTIQKSADIMSAGDTVYIRSGSYAPFRIKNSGTENRYIAFRNYPGEKPLIFGDRQGETGGGQHNIVIQDKAGYWHPIGWLIIEGLEIANAGIDGIKAYNVHHLIIRNNNLHHSYNNNILITGSRHIAIDSNQIHDNGNLAEDRHHYHGIYATGNDYAIVNNLFYAGSGYGIQIAAYDQDIHNYIQPEFENARRWLIANNTFAFFKDLSGIVVWDGYGGTTENINIVNNIFYRNAEGLWASPPNGVYLYKSNPEAVIKDIVIHHNLYFGAKQGIGNKDAPDYQEFDNIRADPLFADENNFNFHLKPDSPAIDAATTLTQVPKDFDNISRPQGSAYDIGAYEYIEGVSSCPADVSHDGTVNVTDIIQVLQAWGNCSGCKEDLDANNSVNVADIIAVLQAWGGCP